ncbi:VWA domain-containing protein [Streptomyces sp. NPDC056910]|uniref:VWA domain-containing protein n=1 Tax=Streptomyces sp. NPDC056910 TaxID=3345964 RepID=UPI0036B5C65A
MPDTSPTGLDFTVEVDAEQDLALGATRADALVTVRATTGGAGEAGARVPRGAEILVMDRSLSMAGFGKLDEAKRAACAAIDTLRDGTLLGIVAGDHRATVIYPPHGDTLAVVDEAVRENAKSCVAAQLAQGGTAIGTWLTAARSLFERSAGRGDVCHAVLYTDGKNEHETSEQLDAALASCGDRFTCDVRGLGDGWNYDELLRITQALHGEADAVVDISDLTEDFVRLMRRAQEIVLPRSTLGLRITELFRLESVRQTWPAEVDLTAQAVDDGGGLVQVPLGAWSPESKGYQVTLRFEAGTLPVDDPVRACGITVHGESQGEGKGEGEQTHLTPEASLIVRQRSVPAFKLSVSAGMTRVESTRELGMAMRALADAHDQGDSARADTELRLALRLAEHLGDTRRLELLRSVAEPGPVPVVRRGVTRGQMQRIGVVSSRTGRPQTGEVTPSALPDGATDSARCPRCDASVQPDERFCECGYEVRLGSGA